MFGHTEKVDELIRCLYGHVMKGYMVHIDSWLLEMFDDYQYKVEGVLVSVRPETSAHLFPRGMYQCGCCGGMTVLDRKNITYWDEDHGRMVCRECRIQEVKVMLPVVATFSNIAKEQYDNIRRPCIEIQDKRRQEGHMERMDELGNRLADTLGGTYFQNRDGKGMREYFLAKRVIRRMRAWRERCRRRYIAKILYECGGIGKDAAWIQSMCVTV
jgi:hypothetical protein